MIGPFVICNDWLFPVWAFRRDGRIINGIPSRIVGEIVNVVFMHN
jgi:hypothetical protein